ncbi:MAG TPA: gamma-glutamyltransferase [Xanthobacteraceae bacterium]|nr:gamma-glutamyltransferase [Xanthobacteraceae bacterium]
MFRLAFSLLAAVLVLSPPTARAEGAVEARNGMVVAQEARAARVGLAVLERGGNAVDAAVATGFAMAVTYPRAGNIGGGGYMVIRLSERQRGPKAGPRNIAIDYRETAPAAATRDMFLDEKGNADPRKSRDSALAIGVPGTVAGLALAHQRYGSGRLTLAELIAPAIALARDGFDVDDDIADSLPRARTRLGRWPASAKIFLKSDGNALGPGDRLVQRDLANTLEAIAQQGPRAFYEGPIAEKLAAGIQAAGGIMTADDLRNYRPHVRQPVRGRYRGHEIISMPPSSSGGVVLIEMLNVLEGYKLNEQDDAARLHLMIEAMRRAYADRAAYLGDPAVVSAPIVRLMSKRYAAQLRANIDPARATPSHEIRSDVALPREGENTTHFSVIDRYGNAVANTYTLNFSYGVGLVAEGTGVLLNNELDDFAARPATPNAYGLIGGDANAPGPNKRPLSSMTPTIVTKNGRPLIVTGSPGGSRIITSVLQVVVNVIDRNMDAAAAVSAPRIHHQWSPDSLIVEQGLPNDVVTALEGRGHKIDRRPYGGTSANTILVTPLGFVGAADPRTRGSLAAGY